MNYNKLNMTLAEAEDIDISNIEKVGNFLDEFNFKEQLTPYTYGWSRETAKVKQVIVIDNDELIFWENGNEERFPFLTTEDIDNTLNELRNKFVELVMESVPKENLELCYSVLDECAKKIGFEPYREADWNRSYRKSGNTNYTYFIHLTPDMDKDHLKLDIFNDTELAEQLVWTIQNANDIRTAFTNLIYPRIEGLE